MKIVILGGAITNPGDISWQPITDLAPTTIHQQTTQNDIVSQLADADIAVSNSVFYSEDVLRQLPTLKMVCILSTGVNKIDLAAAERCGILVSYCPRYSSISTAEHVFALITHLYRNVARHAAAVARGEWSRRAQFSYWEQEQIELYGKRIGIVGFGEIGKAVANIAQGYRMQVCTHTPRRESTHGYSVTYLSFERLLQQVDIVTLHCPLTSHTQHMIDSHALQRMRNGALFINCARGGLVDETALYHALAQKQIAGAALDVLQEEPPPSTHPLLTLDTCVITPHCAWTSIPARQRLIAYCAQNIRAFLAGKPINIARAE